MANLNYIFRLLLVALISLFFQFLVLNNLEVSPLVNPYIYIVVLLSMSFGTSTGTLMTAGFVLGLIVDVFCDTPGMHTASCVLMAYMRQYVLRLFAFHDDYVPTAIPSLGSYGADWYIKYALTLVSIHHFALFFLEQFDGLDFWYTILKIVVSVFSSMVMIMIAQFFMPAKETAR